jgi:hypothetical protein
LAVSDLLQPTADNLSALIVILRAAVLANDRDLERSARRELRERYGVQVSFDTSAVANCELRLVKEEESTDAPA